MLASIDLDHQLRIEADEISNVLSNRHLSAELDAVEPSIAQFVPQPFFSSVGALRIDRANWRFINGTVW